MRTDGLYAFDHSTRRNLERLLRPKEVKRVRKQREYREKKAPSPKPRKGRPLGKGTLCAQAWLARVAAGEPKMTKRAFAALHGVKEKTLGSALYYIRYPEKKNAAKRRRLNTPSP